MYSTCVFCNERLDRNESIEAFPVGKRLAFDAAKGRLWVVCKKCERWNLSPLEERWEAIEQAEKLYRDTRRRVSTDNIGLAKLGDGTTLIRIGEPLRPEFAAWRYGDQFGRRRQRQVIAASAGGAAVGALFIGGAAVGVGVVSFVGIGVNFAQGLTHGFPNTVVAQIHTADGQRLEVRRRHLSETVLSRAADGSMAIDLRFKNGHRLFEGDEARRIAAIVIPKVNRYGGNKATVAQAVQRIESVGSAEAFVNTLTNTSHVYTRPAKRRARWQGHADFHKWGLFGMPAPTRLALEMSLHEEVERRALLGELAELDRAWRDADEIAAISDDLLLPDDVSAALDELKGRRLGP